MFKFCHFCCHVSNSSRPWHRALIEGTIFLKCINEVYVIFYSYRGRYVMSENFWKSVCVYKYKNRFPFKRLWDTKNTLFLPDGILLSIGHFHNNVILLLYGQNPSGFCPVVEIRALICCLNLARISKINYEKKNKNRILVEVVKWHHRVNGLF